MAVFEYDLLRPLAHQPGEMDMIRLLEIHTSDMGSPMIKFSLRQFALQAAPSYMALSYCWGDPNIKQPIWSGDAALDVTTNLHAALTHIRDQFETCDLNDHGDEHEDLRCCTCLQDDHRPRWLWVDAICINQDRNEEKAQQVPLMRQIYSKATKTLIWLGPDIRFYGILLISRLALASRKYHERGDTRVIFQMDLSAQEFYNIPHGFSREYKDLRSLLESPWFQRVWIIQEVAVSKKVLIRSHSLTVEWEELESAVNFATHIGALPLWNNTEIAQQVINIGLARKLTLEDNQQPLLALLLLYRKCKASKDHDKIYALYNLAADGGPSHLNIIPNYDIDSAEVYRDLAVSMIRTTQNLDILSAPHPSINVGVRNLPSWVPDWSISDDTVALRGGPVWFDFAAAPPAGLDSTIFSENDNILGLLGHTIDIVQVTGKLCQEYTEKKLSRLQRMQRAPSDQLVFNDWETVSGCRSGRRYLNGESIMDAYWQTLILGRTPDGQGAAKEEFQHWLRTTRWVYRYVPLERLKLLFSVLWIPLIMLTGLSILRTGFNMTKTTDFNRKLKLAENRRLFRTRGGYIGLAPQLTKSEDRIGLFKGCGVPLVIRQEGSRWRLIGDCYVHGAMKGEAFQEVKAERMWFV